MSTSGFSTTPLAKKLGIKEHYKCLLYNRPKHYFTLFSDLLNNITMLDRIKTETADFIHVFCTAEKELTKIVETNELD